MTLAYFAISPKNQLGSYYENELRKAEKILAGAQKQKNKKAEVLAYANIGYIYYRAKDYDKAIVNLKRAVKISPKDHVVLYWVGMAYFDDGNLIEAEKSLKLAAEYAPDLKKHLPFYDLGRLYEKQNKFDKAIAAYKSSIKSNVKMWNPHDRLGRLYEAKGDYKLALKQYKRAFSYTQDSNLAKAIKRVKGKIAK